MSDQVIRYENERQYLAFKNQRVTLTGGKVLDLPDWGKDPDSYWEAYYEYRHANPEQFLEYRLFLLGEDIKDGVLVQQHVKCDTVAHESVAAFRANTTRINENLTDPGVPVSVKFKDKQDAERMRGLLLLGEPGYYYGIKHFTAVAVIESE